MSWKKYEILTVVTISCSMLIVIGCASLSNFTKHGSYAIEEVNSKGISISKTKAYLDDGVFIVSGQLNRKHVTKSYHGHVDIAVLDSDGNIIDKVSTRSALPFFGRSKRSKTSFKAEFSTVPPEGSIVRVTFHQVDRSSTGRFDCSANAAGF